MEQKADNFLSIICDILELFIRVRVPGVSTAQIYLLSQRTSMFFNFNQNYVVSNK